MERLASWHTAQQGQTAVLAQYTTPALPFMKPYLYPMFQRSSSARPVALPCMLPYAPVPWRRAVIPLVMKHGNHPGMSLSSCCC